MVMHSRLLTLQQRCGCPARQCSILYAALSHKFSGDGLVNSKGWTRNGDGLVNSSRQDSCTWQANHLVNYFSAVCTSGKILDIYRVWASVQSACSQGYTLQNYMRDKRPSTRLRMRRGSIFSGLLPTLMG